MILRCDGCIPQPQCGFFVLVRAFLPVDAMERNHLLHGSLKLQPPLYGSMAQATPQALFNAAALQQASGFDWGDLREIAHAEDANSSKTAKVSRHRYQGLAALSLLPPQNLRHLLQTATN